MKKVLIAVLLLTVNSLFAQPQTLSDYSKTMDECFRVPLETKTICCMADKNGDKRFGNKVLLLLDSQNNVLDEFSFYDANNSGTFFASNTAFVLKGKITEPFQNILIYVSDDDVSFKKLNCENWVADIIVTDKYIIYSTEFDNDTIRRITIETNEMISYKGYYPNVDIYPSAISDVLGVFEYKNKWYKILEDEIIETDESFYFSQSLHAEISFSTDDEAILYVNLTEGDAVLDTFQIVPIAADRKINAAQIVNASSRKYLFLEVYLGTPGGYQTINKVDLLVFDISDNSLNLIETITLTETVYNGKTKSYSSYKDISYIYNADTDTILLFREEDGTFIEQQTIPLSE